MKRIKKLSMYILITLSICIATYFVISIIYNRYLRNINGKTFPIEKENITSANYKDIVYERIIIPACGVDVSIVFEKLHFINDSVLVINKYSLPYDNLFILRNLLGFGKHEIRKEEFNLNTDTLFSTVTQNVGGHKFVEYFTFKFENDSLRVGRYNEKKFK